ncbi:OmpA family protein [Puniceibacterium sp. IMCC21224]|uniref:OmpA family protein n=1 Tax=Puniceibacterium sp. IMCC21224 TaxID=1618204 RepID=UPI00065DB6F3|nr:OmpA family protein [Puniceibacterium sp. IMCC21224]KMK65221.1 outer membrane protein/peptidoglycan-associated (lipo)protein [Puniceibacterium sp. IMCC21224]
MRHALPFALALSGLCVGTPALAQDALSVDELLRLFDRQKQVFSEAENNGLGATRGLKLVTVEDVNAEAATESVSVTADAQRAAIDPNQPIQAAADPDKPLIFGQLDADLQVNLHITFGFDSAALADEEKPKLNTMCQVLQQSDIHLIRIVGHTDTSGSEDYNERLSVLRAKEVARHLTDDCGIDPARLETVGMGERFPYNAGNPRADENRRVEFQALS